MVINVLKIQGVVGLLCLVGCVGRMVVVAGILPTGFLNSSTQEPLFGCLCPVDALELDIAVMASASFLPGKLRPSQDTAGKRTGCMGYRAA